MWWFRAAVGSHGRRTPQLTSENLKPKKVLLVSVHQNRPRFCYVQNGSRGLTAAGNGEGDVLPSVGETQEAVVDVRTLVLLLVPQSQTPVLEPEGTTAHVTPDPATKTKKKPSSYLRS